MSYYDAHIKNDKAKWVVTFIVMALLVVAVIGLGVGLSNQLPEEINASDFKIGALNSQGQFVEDNASIVSKSLIDVEGLEIAIDEDAEVTYKVFFFDEGKEFISNTDALSADFDSTSIPATAAYAKVVIVPTEDAEVGAFEVAKYAKMLTITLGE